MNLPLFRLGWQNAHSASVPVPRINLDQLSIWQSICLVLVLHLFVAHLLTLMPPASLLHFLIGWPRTWMLWRGYESHGAQQIRETASSPQTASVTMHSSFSPDCVVYLHLFKFFCFILPTSAMIMRPVVDPPPRKKTDLTMNNHDSNL
jgi:hypothetical protein